MINNTFTKENTKDATHMFSVTQFQKVQDGRCYYMNADTSFKWIYCSNQSFIEGDYFELSRPIGERREDFMIPIDFSRNITPFVIGDVMDHTVAGRFTLEDNNQVKNLNNGNLNDDDYFIVSFADRPNTGTQPVGDDVVVDVSWDDGLEDTLNCNARDVQFHIDNHSNVESWKPNHAALLKQYQAEQLKKEPAKEGPTKTELEYEAKPVYTQERDDYKAWDGKENLDIGMAYTNGGGEECMFIVIHAGIIIGRPLDMSCHNKLYLSTSDESFCKPIDNRTFSEKATDKYWDSLRDSKEVVTLETACKKAFIAGMNWGK